MSAPAVKPALPAAGSQAPKVGSGTPPATPNNPPPPATGGPKILPTTGSPNRPLVPPNANHTAVGAVPLSLVQEHKAAGGLNQQPSPVNRTPEKPVASTVGIKPTSNGVEGSPNRQIISQPSAEVKKPDEGNIVAAVMNHSADIASVPSQPQPSLHNPLTSGTQLSPAKLQAAPVSPSTTNHTTPASATTNKVETAVAPVAPSATAAVATAAAAAAPPPPAPVVSAPAAAAAAAESKPPAAQVATQSAEPPPAPVQQQSTTLPQQTQQNIAPQLQQQPQQPSQSTTQLQQQQQPQQAPQQNQQQQVPVQQPPVKSTTPTPPAAPQHTAPVLPQTPSQQNPPAAPVQSQTVTPPAQDPPVKPAVQIVEPKTRTTEAAPKPEFKLATPPRNSKRKREVKPPADAASTGSTKISASEQDDRKSKRVRTQTQPYQSPLPELTYIAKLKTLMKSPDDKLIVFYKNEFLAVRNAEGGFYICQAMQNIYKSSARIRIRWLSQEKKDNKPSDVYIPDFYDATDFDCILTNLELKRLDKNKFQLPEEERERTQSILKRALDVEKGVSEKPPVTEEHPDGLDLSLFRDESQLKKRRSLKRATPRKKGKENASGTEDGYGGLTGDESEEEVKKKKPKQTKKVEKPKEKAKTKEKSVEKKAERVSERGRDRSLAAKRRSESTASAVATKNAAVKQTVAKHAVTKTAEKKSKTVVKQTPKKPEPAVESSIPTRSAKTRSVKVTSQPKSLPVTRTKERERRGTAPAKGRKKPGKKA